MPIKVKKSDDLLTKFAASHGLKRLRPAVQRKPVLAIEFIASQLLTSLEDAVTIIELVASPEEFHERAGEIAKIMVRIRDARDYLRGDARKGVAG